MIQELGLGTDLVVGQVVRAVAGGLLILIDTPFGERRFPSKHDGTIGKYARAIEAARTKSLREGVIHHGVRSDVPGQVETAASAGLGLAQVDAEAAMSGRYAGPVGYVV